MYSPTSRVRFCEEPTAIRAGIAGARRPVGLLGNPVGFFASLRFLMGEVNLFLAGYDQPHLLRDMIWYLCDLWLALAPYDFMPPDVSWESFLYYRRALAERPESEARQSLQ
jgi:hypothetical protein